MSKRKTLGFGLGLRSEYYQQILEQRPAVDWFESFPRITWWAVARPSTFSMRLASNTRW